MWPGLSSWFAHATRLDGTSRDRAASPLSKLNKLDKGNKADKPSAANMAVLRLLFAALTSLTWSGAVLVPACSVYDPAILTDGNASQAGRGGSGQNGNAGGSELVDCQQSQGACARANAVATCVGGECLIASCNAPYLDCDSDPQNGCEADLESAEHCGLCNAACRFGHAAASCKAGECELAACDAGYGDCDDNPGNGCERSLHSISDCGACNHVCGKPAYAAAICDKGACGARCEPGHGDCNGKLEDGCEQPLTINDHCGACGTQCEGPQVDSAECKNGHCVVTNCQTGFADCNGDPDDGCEANLMLNSSCGSCSADCELPHVTNPRCDATSGTAQCLVACIPNEPDCTKTNVTGCEADHADCDGLPRNGCETNLGRLSTCGACTSNCVAAHTLSACRDGSCMKTGCVAGYDRCGDSENCQSLLSDPMNCGACGTVCDASKPNCAGGRCTAQTCAAGRADCDADATNTCEVDLLDMANCGGCSLRCPALTHATGKCDANGCGIGSCDAGYADCDQDPTNGCEVDLNGQDDCGACNEVCALAQASSTCKAGKCTLLECNAGRADCNGIASDGCEADLRLPSSCGSCGNNCSAGANVAASSCTPQGCRIRCQDGFADCNDDPKDGCETDLKQGTHCGSCTADCSTLPNTSGAGCNDGACRDLICALGYGDCNGDAADGCERSLLTQNDCGACDKPCAPAHAQPNCDSSQCLHGSCDSGFGDCDGDQGNGCETALSSPQHCGGCNQACEGGAPCKNGTCGCVRDSQCGAGAQCCNNQCVATSGVACFPWPCIPGTVADDQRANCGGCGQLCITFCCKT